jgi:protein TonB
MFDEFRPASTREARRRMGGSMAVASIIYGSLAVLIIGGTKAATHVAKEDLVQVKFAAPPTPEPPPPAPEPVAAPAPTTPRPKAKRRDLRPPDEVPQDKPKESDAPLADAEPSGPVDGYTDGVEGGTGTGSAPPPPPPPPPPKPEPLVPPVALKSNTPPPYSAAARRKEIEGVVVVNFDVLENGSVANVTVVSGPEELRESVLKTIPTWRFEPARRGGRAVRFKQTKAIHFRVTSV